MCQWFPVLPGLCRHACKIDVMKNVAMKNLVPDGQGRNSPPVVLGFMGFPASCGSYSCSLSVLPRNLNCKQGTHVWDWHEHGDRLHDCVLTTIVLDRRSPVVRDAIANLELLCRS